MSLLLEALKKAELAKQSADATPATTKPGADSVITRDTLPDISQPLDIRPIDLPSAGLQTGDTPFGPAPVEMAPLSQALRQGEIAPSPFDSAYSSPELSTAPSDAADSQRAAARQMFEAKEADLPHPKRNFYLTLGALGLFAAGYGGYVWWQLQPRNVYNTAAAKRAAENPVASVPSPPPATPPAAPADATSASPITQAAAPTGGAGTPAQAVPAAAIGGQDNAARTPPSPASPSSRPNPSPSPAPEAGSRPAARSVAPRSVRETAAGPQQRNAPSASSPIAITPPTLALDPQVEGAYEAFQQGDMASARSQYQLVLQRNPASRDALLGLAAIDIRSRNYDLAEARYLKLLEADPRDAHAMAGLIALRGQTDPLQSESRLKSLIAVQPDVAHLHFALGNQYATQSRWPEAQSAYFKAYSLDSENPDFAFNLAVSLDQLRQGKLALDYYRRALALAGSRSAGFDRSQVTARISELSR